VYENIVQIKKAYEKYCKWVSTKENFKSENKDDCDLRLTSLNIRPISLIKKQNLANLLEHESFKAKSKEKNPKQLIQETKPIFNQVLSLR